MNDIILAIAIVIVLLYILIVLLFFTIKRVNILTKKAFINKLQQFDTLIDSRSEQIDQLNNQIQEKKKELVEINDNIESNKNQSINLIGNDNTTSFPRTTNYNDENILNEYKKIKRAFNFDTETIVKKFIEEKVRDHSKYNMLFKKVRNYFNYAVIYKICCYKSDEQSYIVQNLLGKDELNALGKLIIKNNFDINVFIRQLDELIMRTNSEIYIYVSDKKYDYGYLNKNIKIIYDESIAEGFKIVYKGIVYDYSI